MDVVRRRPDLARFERTDRRAAIVGDLVAVDQAERCVDVRDADAAVPVDAGVRDVEIRALPEDAAAERACLGKNDRVVNVGMTNDADGAHGEVVANLPVFERVRVRAELDRVLVVAVELIAVGRDVRTPREEAAQVVAPDAVVAKGAARAGEHHDAGAVARLHDVRIEDDVRVADERREVLQVAVGHLDEAGRQQCARRLAREDTRAFVVGDDITRDRRRRCVADG